MSVKSKVKMLFHATDLRHTFALPKFMTQYNCEDLKLTDTPSTASTFTQVKASSDQFVLTTQWQPSAINPST